jgi:hypothetical protein
MAMFRRSRRSTPPLRHKQQEIARQEAELREKLDKLERMFTNGPPTAQDKSPAHAKARSVERNQPEKRFQVSVAMPGEQAFAPTRRPRPLRKQRREGQIIFLFLLAALAVAVMWLISHLHS